MGQLLHGSATTTEAIIVAFRKHTRLPLDDYLYALPATIPHLTRSSLHRCLQRHGVSKLPDVEGASRTRRSSKLTFKKQTDSIANGAVK
jgi:hypothetical protein